jgi:hypothetical protein
MFQNLCGPDASKNIIVLTTFWDRVTDEIGTQREKQLKETFFKQLVDCGACFMRHDRTFRSAQDVLRHILPLVPMDTLIGKEIVDDGKNLDQTAAGSVHSKDVEEIIAKHKNEMAGLTEEIVVTRKTNKALARELLTERAKLKDKLAKWENERLELKKGLEDKKNARVQLKADEAEKELHKKWRQEVALNGLGDIKIVGGHWKHMDATVVADIFNSSAIDITVSSSVEISYDQARVCWF